MKARRWFKRASLACVLAGLGTTGAGVFGMVGAHATTAAPPGSEFGPLSLHAAASGVRVPMYSSGGEDVEAQLPWATSSLDSGQVGHALTSVFWPGDTGGNGGSTLQLLGSPCILENPLGLLPTDPPCVTHAPTPPDQVYNALNDSYKAESQTGTGKATHTAGGNGVSMKATATQDLVLATSRVEGTAFPAVGPMFGSTSARTNIRVTGPHTAVIDALSVVHNVKIGGDAITIDSITSVAHAVTDARHATGTAETTVTGMRINGVPVTVDSKGVHANGQGTALPSTDAVNQALTPSGFKIIVAKPVRDIKGAAVSLNSGSLIVMQTKPQYTGNANDTGMMFVLGGTSIVANSGLGFPYVPGVVPPPPPVPQTTTTPPAPTAAPAPAASSAAAPVSGPPPANNPVVAASQPTDVAPQLAPQGFTLPGGLSPGWVAVTMVGGALLAAGLRRLPDRVLAPAGAACTLEAQQG